MPPWMETAIIGAVSSLLVALVTYFLGVRQLRLQLQQQLRNEIELISSRVRADLEREYQFRFNERKWSLYTEFSELIIGMLEFSKLPQKNQHTVQKDAIKKLRGFVARLWIVGDDRVVSAYNSWRRTTSPEADSGTDHLQSLDQLMQILIEMRKDLGNSTTEVTPRELLATIVNDIDKT